MKKWGSYSKIWGVQLWFEGPGAKQARCLGNEVSED